MNAPSRSTIALVAGKKESGKTRLVKRGLALVTRWVAWDIKGEYALTTVGVPGARCWFDLREFFMHLRSGGIVEREVFACPSTQFNTWCKWVARTGNLVVVIEELGRHCANGRVPPPLFDLFDRSRHLPIDLIVTTARVERVPKDLRAQVDELLLSRHSEPTDLAYLESWLGGPARLRVETLQPGHFLRFRP